MDRNSELASPQPPKPPAAIILSEALEQGSSDAYSRHIDTSLSGHGNSVEDIDRDRYGALRLKNSLLPFHQIPPEIHAYILLLSLIGAWDYFEQFYIYFWDCDKYYKQLHIYAQVSCRWKSLVLTTPVLWSRVSGNMHPQLCATTLARSGGCPLDVVFMTSSQNANTFPLIAPTIPRWVSIDLTCKDTQDSGILHSALEAPMPNLRIAVLAWKVPLSSPVNLGAGQPGLLNALAIDGVSVPWDSNILLGLKSLAMDSINSHAPTWMQFRDLLQNAIHLETLSMRHVHVSGLSTTFRPSNSIDLPSFRHLFLKKVDPFLVRNMFEAFHFPNCDICDIKLNMENNSLRYVFTPATDHMLPIFRVLANTSEEVWIAMKRGECTINATIELPGEASRTREVLRIRLRDLADPQEFSKWISGMNIDEKSPGAMALALEHADVLPDTIPAEVEVAHHGRKPGLLVTTEALDALRSDIDHLSTVSSLHLSLWGVLIDPLLEYLTLPSRTRTNEVEEWPLPLLQDMYINGCYFTPECLLAMLRARCGRVSWGSKESPSPPRPLNHLQVGRDFPKDIKEEFVRLLGPDNFVCG